MYCAHSRSVVTATRGSGGLVFACAGLCCVLQAGSDSQRARRPVRREVHDGMAGRGPASLNFKYGVL